MIVSSFLKRLNKYIPDENMPEIEKSLKDLLILSKLSGLEEVLIATGRWTKDTPIDIIALSSNSYDRLVVEKMRKYFDKLSKKEQEKLL